MNLQKYKNSNMKFILFLSLSLMSRAFDPTILVDSEFNALRKFLMAEKAKNFPVKDRSPTKRDT